MTIVRTLQEYENQTRTGRYRKRVLIEGDSWVSHPLIRDLADQFDDLLPDDTLILNLGWPGDEARQIFRKHGQQMRKLEALLKSDRAAGRFDLVVLSASGNDVVGPEIVDGGFVRNKRDFPALYGRELIGPAFFQRVTEVVAGYRRFLQLRDRSELHKSVPVATHCYCYLQPRKVGTHWGDIPFDNGWIAKHLQNQGIRCRDEQRDVVEGMLDALWGRLARLEAEHAEFVVVDTRKVLMKSGSIHMDWWQDEIHPTAAGFRRVARSLIASLQQRGHWIAQQ